MAAFRLREIEKTYADDHAIEYRHEMQAPYPGPCRSSLLRIGNSPPSRAELYSLLLMQELCWLVLIFQPRLFDRPKWAERILAWERAALRSCGVVEDAASRTFSAPRAAHEPCVGLPLAMAGAHKVVG